MKTFEEVKLRFNALKDKFIKKGIEVNDLILKPPVSEKIIIKYEKKWQRRIPSEIRDFFLNTAGYIDFDWIDSKYMDTGLSSSGLPNIEFNEYWPLGSASLMTLDQIDGWLTEIWPLYEESYIDECYQGAPSPYDYNYSFPFIYGSGGEFFVYYDPPNGEKFVYIYGYFRYGDWAKFGCNFFDFWDRWSLLGCPHFGGFDMFYDQKNEQFDPYGENGMAWRKAMGIDKIP